MKKIFLMAFLFASNFACAQDLPLEKKRLIKEINRLEAKISNLRNHNAGLSRALDNEVYKVKRLEEELQKTFLGIEKLMAAQEAKKQQIIDELKADIKNTVFTYPGYFALVSDEEVDQFAQGQNFDFVEQALHNMRYGLKKLKRNYERLKNELVPMPEENTDLQL